MKKKVLATILSLSMAVALLCGCGSSPADNAPAEGGAASEQEAPAEKAPAEAAGDSGEAKTYNIAMCLYNADDNFMVGYRNELQSYFKSLETDTVKYNVVIADGKADMGTQTEQVRGYIAQGFDLLILNLVQTSSADSMISELVDAKMPCVLINREPLAYDADGNILDESYEGILNNAEICYVGADARQSGTYQGEIVAELADHGDLNGDGVISYIMIEGDPENIDAQYRTEYSIKALEDAGYKVECLDDQVGNWALAKGQEICANALTQHGDKVEVVFCNNDAMALGAYAAIDAQGRKVGEDIYLLGVDALDECQEMVQKGTMTGTVLNDAVGQSHAAVDVAVKLLNGEAIDNYYWIDYVKVTQEYFK